MDKLKPKDPNSFYAYHFLQRLLREVRILLAHKDLQDMHALADQADQLMALHQPRAYDAVATVQLVDTASKKSVTNYKQTPSPLQKERL
jgi:hypothetical protein